MEKKNNSSSIQTYYLEIFFEALILLGILIALKVIFELLELEKDPVKLLKTRLKIQSDATKGALLLLVANTYFFYLAYKTYKKSKKKSNYNFLIASGMVFLGNLIKFWTLYNAKTDIVTGVEDI